MFLKTSKKIYEFNFGLRGLILLRENPKLMMEKDKKFFLYSGLISHNPDITEEDIDIILAECQLDDSFFTLPILPSIKETEELYLRAVGEMGITPSEFYQMSLKDLDLAYEGYLRRQETQANLMKLAIMKSYDGSLIRLTEDKGYSIGNIDERQATFKKLNISKGE